MTDDLARELEEVAGSVPPIPNDYATLKSLIQTLPQPLAPDIRSAITGTVNTQDPGLTAASQVANTLTGGPIGAESGSVIGVVSELFYANSNLLWNPLIEQVDITGDDFTTGTDTLFARYWYGKYVLNSGSAPDNGMQTDKLYDRTAGSDNPMNSTLMEMYLGTSTSGATDYTAYIYQTSKWSAGIDSALPFLVASVKVSLWGSALEAHCTKLQMRMEIVDDTGVTAGPWFNWLEHDAEWTVYRLSVARPRPATGWFDPSIAPYQWRLRIDYAYDQAEPGGIWDWFTWGEPALALSSTQAPPPYAPILAKWVPHDGYNVYLFGNTYPMASYLHNELHFGPGDAEHDVAISRYTAGVLTFDDGGGGPITLDVVGSVQIQDVSLSRVAAGAFKIASTTSADDALYIGDDAILFDGDIGNRLGIKGQQDATLGGFMFGSSKKPELYRESDEGLTLKHDAATGLVPLIKKKTSDQQILNTNVLTNVTGLEFAVKANSTYAVRWVVAFTVDSSTADGLKLAVNGPTGCVITIRFQIPTTAAASTDGETTGISNTLDSGLQTAAISSTTFRYIAIVEGVVANGSNAGTVNLRAASDTATTGDVTIRAGSFLMVA